MPGFPTVYIKHQGFFDKEALVKGIQNWLKDIKFEVEIPKYKVKADEFELDIKADKEINEYVKFILKVWARAWEVKEIEVIENGEKKKKHQGRIAIEINSNYELDPYKRFKGNKILQILQDFYNKYIIKRTIEEEWELELINHQTKLVKFIKKNLGQDVE